MLVSGKLRPLAPNVIACINPLFGAGSITKAASK
jgi:hypothetical protein